MTIHHKVDQRLQALQGLIDQGALTGDGAHQMLEKALFGEHVIFVGPDKRLREDLCRSLASDLSRTLPVAQCPDHQNSSQTLVEKIRLHSNEGKAFVYLPMLGLSSLLEILIEQPGCTIVGSVPVGTPRVLKTGLALGLCRRGVGFHEADQYLGELLKNIYHLHRQRSGTIQKSIGIREKATFDIDQYGPGWELDEDTK